MFLLGSHLTSFIFIKVFIGILGESVQIQFLAIFYIDLNKGFNQIWHRCFLTITVLLRFPLEYYGESVEIKFLAVPYLKE